MSVSSTERLDELDALLPARPAGRNIIGFAIEAIKELRKDVVHWREARRTCLEAGDMMKTEIERLRDALQQRLDDLANDLLCDFFTFLGEEK